MSAYSKDKLGLIEMVQSPDNNNELPAIFVKVINNLEKYNSIEYREKRMKYAREFSYAKNVKRIEHFITTARLSR